jgi:hypothetical protein
MINYLYILHSGKLTLLGLQGYQKQKYFPYTFILSHLMIRVGFPFRFLFFCFAKHETMRNKRIVSRNFVCFAKQKNNEISFRFVSSKIKFRFVS